MIPAQYKLVAWLLVAASLAGGGFYAGLRWSKADVLSEQLKTAQADAQRNAATAKQTADALADYQKRVTASNAYAVQAEADRRAMAATLDQKRKAYDALPKSMVAADCRLSPERLQQLQSTFDAAFNRANPGTVIASPPVPATR